MPRFAANLSMLFNEVDFLDRFGAAARAGFKGVEYVSPYEYDKEQIVDLLRSNSLTQVLHNMPVGDWDTGDRGMACDPGRVGEFRDSVGTSIEFATALGCPKVNCLAGYQPRSVSTQLAHETLVDNLKFAALEFEKAGVLLLIEPINTIDMPGFFINRTHQARSIIGEVGSQNLRIQHDIYHMQIMEGDLARTIEGNLDVIGHFQLADNPGRHEPGTGEINYPYLFDLIDSSSYDGWIGCEYRPKTTTAEGLGWTEGLI